MNEFGEKLFAHTSPIYVSVGGKPRFDAAAARELIVKIESEMREIAARGRFTDDARREAVLRLYREAVEKLRGRLE